MTEQRERRKVRVGRVVSDKMDKTVVVAVERRVQHRLYGKSRRHVTRFAVHDEANDYRLGDTVRIVETRPLSRTKRWRVFQLLARQEVLRQQPSKRRRSPRSWPPRPCGADGAGGRPAARSSRQAQS